MLLNFGNPGVDDGPTCLKIYNNTLYISGYSSKKAYIAALDLEGNILWKKYFTFSYQRNFISDFIIDDNNMYLCGYGHDSGQDMFDEFFVSLNTETYKVNWARQTALQIKPNNIHLVNNQLVISGDEYAQSKFGLCYLKLNTKNGKLDSYKNWYFYGHESASVSTIKDNLIISGGRYGLRPKTDKYRAGISIINLDNLEQKEHHYFLNDKAETARAYLSDFVLENDSIITSCYSNRTGIDNKYTLSMFKSDLAGNTAWAYEYKLPGFNSISSKDMMQTNDGYYILGNTKSPKENVFLMKTDKAGFPMYAYIMGGDFADNIIMDQGSFMLKHKGKIYITAQSKNYNNRGDFDSFIFSFNEKNMFADSCIKSKKIMPQIIAYEELVEGTLVMENYDTAFRENNITYEALKAPTEILQYLCKPEQKDSNQISFDNMAFNNTVFLLDASLSMNRNDRLPVLKQAFFNLLNYLRPEDLVSVVTFSNKANVLLSGESAANKEMIQSKINESTSGGQSDILSAVQEGFKLADKYFNEEKNNRIIITTDGDLSFATLKSLEELLLKNKKEGVYVSIFLFNNSSVYVQQLETIAQNVNASVYVITPQNVEDVLLNQLSKRK
ncbi:MAG: VWA domain-containing protein [Chitinophagales bacterium]|nr:VWA domain-containing protein [Chitinophagales bacterium]